MEDAYFYSVVAVVAVTAIYYLWARKLGKRVVRGQS
jgi:hypothetical protein